MIGRCRCAQLGSAGRLASLALLLLAATPVPGVASGDEADAGFFFSRDRSLGGSERVRLLGPIAERSTSGEVDFRAIRPFFSRLIMPRAALDRLEALWPVYTRYQRDNSSAWRFLNIVGHNFDVHDSHSRWRVWAIPFLFTGRDIEGHRYLGVFPLYGSIHEILGFDRVFFILFPLYGEAIADDMESHAILWPFIAWGQSASVHRYRVFPFYGQSENRHAGTVRRFILWPFWTSTVYSKAPGHAYILFPLFGRVALPGQSTWMILPPLFRITRAGDDLQMNLPWPFIQYRRGSEERFYLWPLLGSSKRAGRDRCFFLWPFIRYESIKNTGSTIKSFKVVPFFHYENRSGPDALRYRKLWPLAEYERVGNTTRFRVLALWPLRGAGPVERNLAPLWTLFSRNHVDQARETELLWGLFRHRSDGAGEYHGSVFPLVSWNADSHNGGRRGWSILKGLLEYERTSEARSLRLLYLLRFDRSSSGSAE